MEPQIIDPFGKTVQSQRYSPCPKCGRGPDQRIPSSSFGENIYLVCYCGNEFNKELKCPRPIV